MSFLTKAISWTLGIDEEKIHRLRIITRRYKKMPAMPYKLESAVATLLRLKKRDDEVSKVRAYFKSEKDLTPKDKAEHNPLLGKGEEYTIDGQTESGFQFMFNEKEIEALDKLQDDLLETLTNKAESIIKEEAIEILHTEDEYEDISYLEDDPKSRGGKPLLTSLTLDTPEQYAMSWNNLGGLHDKFVKKYLPRFAATLKSAENATKDFFPIISEYGLAYNLLVTQKVTSEDKTAFIKRDLIKANWSAEMDELLANGQLYAIDFGTKAFDVLKPQKVNGIKRFTPSTITFLKQDPTTKDLRPIAVYVKSDTEQQWYQHGSCTASTWVYALQAAKVSMTVYGIWLGHVYQWHIVTAAMQMTLHNTFKKSKDHPVYRFLAPHSQHLIGFDTILLLLWKKSAPPTSIASRSQFFDLCNNYAAGRTFADDNPNVMLQNLNISEADFTHKKAWDKYKFVPQMLTIWDNCEAYAEKFVQSAYASDEEIRADKLLQKWIKRSGSKRQGNIKGLPEVNTRIDLVQVLTNLLYRTTVHGNSRMNDVANPGMVFVGNFPPTMHISDLPTPDEEFTTKELLRYMPNTGTIGKMVSFYFTFVYTEPYEGDVLLPATGLESQLPFEGGVADAKNKATIEFREAMDAFIKTNREPSANMQQWPASIET